MQPSAASRREFRAAVLGLKAAPAEVRKRVSAVTRAEGNPIWREAITTRALAGSSIDAALFIKGARIAAGNPSQAVAASSRRAVTKAGGGLVPDRDGRAWEFGAVDRKGYSHYRRKGPGKAADVKRRTRVGMPAASRRGRVVYPAWSDTAPRLVSLWVQTIVRTIHEAYEGKVR